MTWIKMGGVLQTYNHLNSSKSMWYYYKEMCVFTTCFFGVEDSYCIRF